MEQKSFLLRNKALIVAGACIFFGLSWLMYSYAPLDGHYEVDSPAYQRVACIFLETGTVQDVNGTPPIHTQGYHFFLGIFYWLFGVKLWPIILIQVVLSFCALLLTTRVALLLCGPVCAQLVYMLAVIDGAFLIYPQFILADTLLLFLIALFLERMAIFYTGKKRAVLLQAGLILGLSLIVKPTALFLPICFAVCFGMLSLITSVSVSWADLGLFCAALYAPVVLYVVRNGLVFGYYKFSFLMDFNLYCWFPAMLFSKIKNISFEQSLVDMQSLADTRYSCLESAYWKQMRIIFFDLVFSHPCLVVGIWIQNLLKTFFGLFSVQLQLLFDPALRGHVMPFFATQGSLLTKVAAYGVWAFQSPVIGICMLVEFLMNGLRWLLVLFGMQVLLEKRSYEQLVFFFCIVGCFSIVTGFFGAGRYRTTFEPILLILAAQGMVRLYKKYKRIKLDAFKKAYS